MTNRFTWFVLRAGDNRTIGLVSTILVSRAVDARAAACHSVGLGIIRLIHPNELLNLELEFAVNPSSAIALSETRCEWPLIPTEFSSL